MGSRGGPLLASADRLSVSVTGKGGHASEPYRALDPIPVACEIVQALQTMVTRSIDVFDPSVVTVGRISAGTTNNVIPETAEIEGTIRAVSERTRTRVHDGIRRVVEGVAAAHGCAVDVEIEPGYPVTVNDDDFAETTLGIAEQIVGRRQGRAPGPPDHGRRGLELRAPAGAGGDDVPRRHPSRPRRSPPPPRTTPTGCSSTRRRW